MNAFGKLVLRVRASLPIVEIRSRCGCFDVAFGSFSGLIRLRARN
jgi:hypothetical protein